MEPKSTPALVRTIVPMVVGVILSGLASLGLEPNDTTQSLVVAGVTGLLSAAYYVVVFTLESRWPVLGKLLGVANKPKYQGEPKGTSGTGPATATSDTSADRR